MPEEKLPEADLYELTVYRGFMVANRLPSEGRPLTKREVFSAVYSGGIRVFTAEDYDHAIAWTDVHDIARLNPHAI